jgi:hypothetical protein
MTKQEKQLLLIDLCARLPYGVILNVDNGKYREDKKIWPGLFNSDSLWDAKPYLRPMSSMTEEERLELSKLTDDKFKFYLYTTKPEIVCYEKYNYLEGLKVLDWLNAHHFDYRGLIQMGLALEATEGMYK